MAFLDESGLAHFWEKVKAALSGKQNTLTAGDGLSKEGDTLGVDTPVRSVCTQEEYDALPEEQRNKGLYVIPGTGGGGSGGGSLSGEVYSTEETRIGTWIDGKPLYRRVVTGVVTTLNTDLDVGDPIPDIETVTSVVGTFTNGGGYWYPHQTFVNGSSSITAFISAKVSQGRIQVRTSFSLLVNQKCYITVEYTKTTDQPEVSA